VEVDRDVPMALRDGVRLVADVYRPALNGRTVEQAWPVLVERTPYDKSRTAMVTTARYFARRGYVVVIQDVRGRYGSDGDWWAFVDEGEDGFDTVEWIATRSWCDGRIGTIGLSYSASNQSALASLAPPHLRAMFVSQGMSNYHTVGMRQGGALEGRFFISWFMLGARSKEARADRVRHAALADGFANVRQWLRHTPYTAGSTPLRHAPIYERWLLEVQRRADYDQFWMARGLNVEPYYDQHADVPTFLLGGWYDTYTRATTDNFVALRARKRSPVRMLIGPWIHGADALAQSYAGDVDFGADAALDDYNGLRVRWFDATLKGLPTGLLEGPPVRLFVMGGGSGLKTDEGRLSHGGSWRDEPDWPLTRAIQTPYYLRAGGGLSPQPPVERTSASSYTFDPRDPVPTIGGNISAAPEVLPAGAFDQCGAPMFFGCTDRLPLAARADVRVFHTLPLESPIEVTGPLRVELWISSSARDTDFTAKLIDWYPPSPDYPDGYAMNLADSIIRTRYRESRDAPRLLAPNEICKVTIVLNPTSNLFAAGHRIRLDISSSNYPRFDVNPNSGGAIGEPSPMLPAHNTVYHQADHPSCIVLPVIPE
jgi:putative CocE/NonD family hydrolase